MNVVRISRANVAGRDDDDGHRLAAQEEVKNTCLADDADHSKSSRPAAIGETRKERYMCTARLFVAVLTLAAGSAAAKERPRHYTYRPVSIAFVPGFSTNGPDSREVSSNFSLNIIGGNLGQLHGVELGSVFNLEEDDVLGFQAAGAANVLGGSFGGLQQAGAVNIVGNEFAGAQMAGAANVVGGDFVGAQMAGAVNIVGNGFAGAQLAGAVNVAGQDLAGVQLAGAANIATERFRGLQLSGAVNVAEEFSGAQIGVVNIVGMGRGLQLGVVNIAEEMDVPIGLVSIVESGQFHVNAWASEFSLANIGIKMGSRTIYNVFMFGCQPGGDSTRLLAGLGIGGHIALNRFFVDIDAVGHSVGRGPEWLEAGGLRLLSSLRLTGGWQLTDMLALTAGPSLNVWVSDREDGSAIPLYDLPLFHHEGDVNVRIWPGFTIGLQLL
jgi:uncharacterized protein YjbI with pentapeptide repeats